MEKSAKQVKVWIELYKKYFLNRTDILAAQTLQGKPCPIISENLDEILESHLTGKPIKLKFRKVKNRKVTTWDRKMSNGARIGTYMPGGDGTTRVACFDIDGSPDKAAPVKSPDEVVKTITTKLDGYSIKYLIEKSRSGEGWHVWIFFSEPVEAEMIRRLLFYLVPKDVPLTKGGMANAKSGKGIEIFPKSDTVKELGVGGMVFLPEHHGAKNGNNAIYDLVNDKFVLQESPRISPNSPKIVTDALYELDHQEAQIAPATTRIEDNEKEWKIWRKEALSKISLQDIYGSCLTGEVQDNGWLKCRDSDSPTGDKNPSAGVNDTDESCERGLYHSFISGDSLSVFDYMAKIGKARDFKHALQLIAEMTGVQFPMPLKKLSGLPEVLSNGRQQREVIADTWTVVHNRNKIEPNFFRNGNVLVQTMIDPLGGGDLVEIDQDQLTAQLIDSADWIRTKKDGSKGPSLLPLYVPKLMTVQPSRLLPPLTSITGAPFFSRTKKLVTSAGYHECDEIYLNYPKNFHPIEGIKPVSANEAGKGISWLLEELFSDFYFTKESDKTHLLAAIIQPLIRRMFDGPTPLYLISAPSPSSGKTLLAKLISMIVIGTEASARVLSRNEEERRKMFLSELILGRQIIFLDNLDDDQTSFRSGSDKLHSPAFASILTSVDYTDRLLGQSKMVKVQNLATWIMTGNNPQLSLELSRRCVLCRLEPPHDNPMDVNQRNLKHKDIIGWTRDNRALILKKILSAVNSWVVAGMPSVKGRTLGSYENWSNTMRSLLAFLGRTDFLENQDRLAQTVDPLKEVWSELVGRWHKKYGSTPISTTEILQLDIMDGILSPLIRSYEDETGKKVSLGKQLSKQSGRIYRDFRISIQSDGHNGNKYALIPVKGFAGGSREIRGDSRERSDAVEHTSRKEKNLEYRAGE